MALRRALTTAALLGLLAAAPGAAADPSPVGLWQRSDGRQVRISGGGASYTATIAKATGSCIKVGMAVWRMQGSGPSFTGTTYFYDTSTCAESGWGSSRWTLSGDTLTHCAFSPSGADTGCADYHRVAAPGGTTTTTPPAADTSPPQVRVTPTGGRARPGSTIGLTFRVKDDSGKARVHVLLYEGGTKVAEIVKESAAQQIFTPRSLQVQLGAGLVGPLYYCVWAEDAAGNQSARKPMPCGWLSLVAPLAKVSNGCGGSGWESWVKTQNYLLDTSSYYDPATKRTYRVSFREACNLHDAGYGGYTVQDPVNGGTVDFRTWSRPAVDRKFLRDMQLLCERRIPAAAKTARAACKGNGTATSIGAGSRYDAVERIGYRFFDAELTAPGVQKRGGRSNF